MRRRVVPVPVYLAALVCLVGLLFLGWIANVVKLITGPLDFLTVLVRAVGILVPPIGGIVGYF